jgi:hypothetical protein
VSEVEWPDEAIVEVRKGRSVVARLRRLFPGDLAKLHLPVELRPLEPTLRAVEAYEAAPPSTPDERADGGALGAMRAAIIGLADLDAGGPARLDFLTRAANAGAALRVELRRLRAIEAAAQVVLQGIDPARRGRKLNDLAAALEGRAPAGPCPSRHRLGRPCELGAGHEGEHAMAIGDERYTWADAPPS